MNEPKPFGMWTRDHIVADPRCPYTRLSIGVELSTNPDLPRLIPDLRAGGQHLYSEATVEQWFADLEKWRLAKPERMAAKRAEKAAREQYELEQTQREIEASRRAQIGWQEATDKAAADRAEYQQQLDAEAARTSAYYEGLAKK